MVGLANFLFQVAQNSLNDLDLAERGSKFESPECGSLLRQRRYVRQPRVAVARRLPWDDSTTGNRTATRFRPAEGEGVGENSEIHPTTVVGKTEPRCGSFDSAG